MIGRRFGRLLVVENGDQKRTLVCLCDCGNRTRVWDSNLRAGRSRSCGCLNKELSGDRSRTHGMTRTHPYQRWCSMMARCYRHTEPAFARYGGRGIDVCARWRDCEGYCADTGERVGDMSIDRIDNDGGYWCGKCDECVSLRRPTNWRWATPILQAVNRRSTIMIAHSGTTLPLPDWCDLLGVSRGMVRARILKGWDPERALTAPPEYRGRSYWKRSATCDS